MGKPLNLLLLCLYFITYPPFVEKAEAQKPGSPVGLTNKNPKPFKILTNNRQITLQAKMNIKSLMVWTAGGQRIVEQKELNNTTFSFIVPVKEPVIFLLVETADGKRYTEKVGVKQ
jgi:hypothetical protein